jgi:hypothetical protein
MPADTSTSQTSASPCRRSSGRARRSGWRPMPTAESGEQRLGDAWLMNPHTTLPTLQRRQLALFKTRRRSASRRRRRSHSSRKCYVAPTRRPQPPRRAPSSGQVRGLPAVGAGQGAPGRRDLRVGLRGARAGPLPAGRSRPRQRRDRPLSRRARRHGHHRPRPVARHGAGPSSENHQAPGRQVSLT